jgi:hypothetical protein
MPTSGTYTWDPSIDDIVAEAFERAGIDDSAVTSGQRASARRSFNFMLVEWQNKGVKQWLIEQRSVTLTASDATPTVDARMIDILDMVLRRDGVDTPVQSIGRAEYLGIPDKLQEGRPDRFWVDRQQGSSVLTLWPVPENSTDVIIFNQLRRAQDIAEANAATAAETADLQYLWLDAAAADLAKRVALKFAPKRFDVLKAEAENAYRLAKQETRERADVTMTIGAG